MTNGKMTKFNYAFCGSNFIHLNAIKEKERKRDEMFIKDWALPIDCKIIDEHHSISHIKCGFIKFYKMEIEIILSLNLSEGD